MRLRTEAVLAPLGLRPRHLVALTVLRDRGGSTQQALAATLEMDGTKFALSAVEDEVLGALDDSQRETLYSLLQQAAAGTAVSCTEAVDD